jgi:hypothetical protein
MRLRASEVGAPASRTRDVLRAVPVRPVPVAVAMSFPVTEAEGQLHQAGQVKLDSSGNGVLTFDPSNARQRWVVKTVVVSTSQAATATVVPVATVCKNTAVVSQLSQGNNRGQSWSGNQDVFAGEIDISPADYLSVLFSPPPGATGGQIAALSGVVCYATVAGTKYTRRT